MTLFRTRLPGNGGRPPFWKIWYWIDTTPLQHVTIITPPFIIYPNLGDNQPTNARTTSFPAGHFCPVGTPVSNIPPHGFKFVSANLEMEGDRIRVPME